jgi:hypothetical protein
MTFQSDQGIDLQMITTEEQTIGLTPVSEDFVVQVLKEILDTRNYPLCLMDNVGRHRVGFMSEVSYRSRLEGSLLDASESSSVGT